MSLEEDTLYQSEVSKETGNTFSALNTGDLIQGRG